MSKQSEHSLQASKQKEQSTEFDLSDRKNVQTDNEDLVTESLDEALDHWTSQLPPFIDYAIPTSMEPGESMQVWKASENAAPVKKNSPRTQVTCRAWRDTAYKYWTCDIHGWRYIVGGMGVPNSQGLYAWFIWHGLEHKGFTKRRVLWTTSETGNTTTFTPHVEPLNDGTFLGQTDSNQLMRDYDELLQKLNRRSSDAQLSTGKHISSLQKSFKSPDPGQRAAPLTGNIDSPAISHAQRSSKRQRHNSPSSQLQSPTSPSDVRERIQQLSQWPKRHRPNAGFYAQQLCLNEPYSTPQHRGQLDKTSLLLADQSGIERTVSTRISPETEDLTEIQSFVAPTATMTPRIASTAATEFDLGATEASDAFSSPTVLPATRNLNSKARASVTMSASARQSLSQVQRHPEPVKPGASVPTEAPSSTTNNAASQRPPPRENDESSTGPGNIDTPESPLSEEDQLKVSLFPAVSYYSPSQKLTTSLARDLRLEASAITAEA